MPPPVAESRGLRLRQNQPNPFARSTDILFDLPRAAHVELRVFDAGGRLVDDLFDGRLPAGPRILALASA